MGLSMRFADFPPEWKTSLNPTKQKVTDRMPANSYNLNPQPWNPKPSVDGLWGLKARLAWRPDRSRMRRQGGCLWFRVQGLGFGV